MNAPAQPNYAARGLLTVLVVVALCFVLGFALKDHIHGARALAVHGPWVHSFVVGFALFSVAVCVIVMLGLAIWVIAQALFNCWKAVCTIGFLVSTLFTNG